MARGGVEREVAGKREARLRIEGKRSENETESKIDRWIDAKRWGRAGGEELQRQREKLMSRVCQPPTSIIYVQAGDARERERWSVGVRGSRLRTHGHRVSDILIPPSCIPTASPPHLLPPSPPPPRARNFILRDFH